MVSKEEIQIILETAFKGDKQALNKLKALNQNISKAGKNTKQVEKDFDSLGKTLRKVAGVVGIGYAIKQTANFTTAIIKSRGEMEQYEIAFEVMLGSAEKAGKLLEEITEFAEKTPFELNGLVKSSKELLAFGVEADKVIPTLETLGNIASGTGVDISRLTFVFGQVKTAGKLFAQDLNQFTQAGVPLISALAKEMNIAEEEVKKFGSEGKIAFEDVERALTTLSNTKFANLMARQNNTVLGQFSNLQDVIGKFTRSLGKPLEGVVKKTTQSLIGFFERLVKTVEENEDAIREWAEDFMEGVSTAFDILKRFGSYAVDFFSNQWVQAVGLALISWKTFASAVSWSLGGITKALVLVGGAMAYLGNRVENSVDKAFKQVESTAGALKNVYSDLKSSLGGELGFDVENKTTTTTAEVSTKKTQETGSDPVSKEKKLKDDLLAIDKEYNLKRKQEENRALEEQIDLNNQFIFDDERKIKAKENEAENIKNLGEIEVEREREKLDLLRKVKGEDNELVIEQQAEFENVKFEAQLESDQAVKEASDFKISNQKKNDDKSKKQKQKSVWEDHKIENKNFKFASNMASQYVALTQSKNKELNRIGQAAAIAQIGMDTTQSVVTIFKNTLAFFGGTGPLAFSLATAATIPVAAFGAMQMAEIAKNSFAVGSPNIEQDQLANIHKGEIIVPKTFSDGLRDGDLMLGNAKSLDNQQTDEQRGGLTIINNFEGANFYGVADSDEMVKQMSEAISENIADGIIQPFPTEQI